MSLRVVWYNVNGIKGKFRDILKILETDNIDILMVQEAHKMDEQFST